MLIQGIGTICTDEFCQPVMFLNRVHIILESKYSTVYHLVSKVMNNKAQFEAVLKMYLHTHSFYSV
jgi:hypothetical protein